jgi:hypothetical protein
MHSKCIRLLKYIGWQSPSNQGYRVAGKFALLTLLSCASVGGWVVRFTQSGKMPHWPVPFLATNTGIFHEVLNVATSQVWQSERSRNNTTYQISTVGLPIPQASFFGTLCALANAKALKMDFVSRMTLTHGGTTLIGP